MEGDVVFDYSPILNKESKRNFDKNYDRIFRKEEENEIGSLRKSEKLERKESQLPERR
jgi:hypothetical protein